MQHCDVIGREVRNAATVVLGIAGASVEGFVAALRASGKVKAVRRSTISLPDYMQGRVVDFLD
jgi:hypothetical protein